MNGQLAIRFATDQLKLPNGSKKPHAHFDT